jgi:DNA-binding transcriptional LysR family regulator
VGEQIVDRAHQVMYLMQDVVKQPELAKGLHGGQLRISSFRSAATHILPEVMAQFCRRYPAIAVSIAEYDDRPVPILALLIFQQAMSLKPGS